MSYARRLGLKNQRFNKWPFRPGGLLLLVSFGISIFVMFGMMSQPVWATPPSKQPLTEVIIHLGNSANELRFEPSQLTFDAGQRYKLRLDNPSAQKHYFTAKDFADAIWSQKVEAGAVEVKGAIDELELKSGAEAEWVFVAMKPGHYELHCSIPGHTEAGMTGSLTIR